MTLITREIQAVLSLQSQQWEAGWNRAASAMQGFGAQLAQVNTGITGIQQALQQTVPTLQNLDKTVQGMSFAGLSSQLGQIGRVGETALTGVIGAAARFEAEMRNVNTIAKLGESDFRAYSEQVRSLGPSIGVGIGPAQAAAATYTILSSNFRDAASANTVLVASLKAASAGLSEAKDTARVMTATMNAYKLGANEATRVSDVLFTTVDRGTVEFPQLAQSMGLVTGTAAKAGIALEELGAAIATATTTLDAPVAIEGLRNVISHLQAPTKEAREEMERLHIVVNENTLRQKGLAQTLIEINNAAGGSAASIEKLVGGQRGLTAALALVGDGGQLFVENMRAMADSSGATDRALQEQQKSLEHHAQALKALGEAVAVSFGETALPLLGALTEKATETFHAFDSLPGPIKTDILLLAGLATGATLAVAGLAGILAVMPALTAAAATVVTGLTTFGATMAGLGVAEFTALLGTQVTATGLLTGAVGAVRTAYVGLTATTLTTSGAMTALSGGLGFVATGFKAALAAATSFGGVLTLIAGTAVAAQLTIAEMNKTAAAQSQYDQAAADSLKNLKTALEDSHKSAEELAKGRSLEQLRAEMEALKNAAEDTRERLSKGLIGKEDAEREINTVNAALQRLRDVYFQVGDAQKKHKDQAAAGAVKGDFTGPVLSDKDQKALKTRLEKERKEGLDKALDEVDILEAKGKITDEEKVRRLKQILDTYKLTASERRTLEERIAKDEQRLAQETAKAHQEAQRARQQATLESIQIEKQGVDRQIADLNRKAASSAAFDGPLRTAIEKRLALELKEIQQQGAISAAAAKSAEERVQIEANTQARIRNAREQASRDKAEPVEQRKQKEQTEAKKKAEDETKDLGSAEVERLHLEQARLDDEIQRLEEQRSKTAANVEQAIVKRINEKLALQERELRQEAELAKAQTDSARVKEAVQVNLELKLKDARREAAQEAKKAHEEQLEATKAATAALEKQKKAVEEVKTALQGGRISSQDEAFAQLNEQFGIEGTRKRIEEQRKANQAKPFAPGGATAGAAPVAPAEDSPAVAQLKNEREASRLKAKAEIEAARRGGGFGGGPTFAGVDLQTVAPPQLPGGLPKFPTFFPRDPSPVPRPTSTPSTSSVTNVVNNVTIRADGQSVTVSDIVSQAVGQVMKAIRGHLQHGALRQGPGAPPGGLGPLPEFS